VLGPWRDITLVHRRVVDVRGVRIATRLVDGHGVVDVECRLPTLGASAIAAVTLELGRDGISVGSVRLTAHGDDCHAGQLRIANPELWWPHTHGTPALYAARLKGQVAESAFEIDLGSLGFRDVQLDTTDGRFALRINGVPVFCRGACWTPPDPVNLDTPAADSLAMLERVRDAGLNMVRVGGTMVYENDAFLDACDALGIMVWQDFMFANMDYPGDDENFLASVQAEATQELARWQARPCMAVLCGNSEVEQQAAMWGAPRDAWTSPLFHEHLAQLAKSWLPEVPYWPSSAHGGAFPHQGDQGSTSYYGVGAYLRDYSDARTSEVAFATECLAFANIPHDAALSRMPGGVGVRVHHPGWKQRSPRDLGAGWDFDDVRDHYLAQEFKIDPVRLRYSDPDRYVMLGRIATGTAMAAAFAQWRRPASRCGGALVWFLRDLWAGAGWGLFDDRGVPKSCLHMIAPLLAPVAVWFTDEGGNGVAVHVANDRGEPICGELELIVLRPGGAVLVQARKRLDLEAHGSRTVNAAEWFDEFIDLAYAYRFGPAGVEAVVANLLGATGERLAQGFFFPGACADSSLREPELAASARLIDGSYLVTVSSQHIARAVHFEVEGHEASAEYFNIAPGEQRDVIVRALPGHTRPMRGTVRALNSALRAPLKVQA
jgi:beta-mannosidase